MPLTHPLIDHINISYYTVPAAWILCVAPHIYAIRLYDKVSKSDMFDKVNPRTLLTALESNATIDPATKRRIARAEAAQINGFENLGFFAGAVVAANAAGVDTWWTNVLSISYLLHRGLFNVFYVNGLGGFTRGAAFYGALGSVYGLPG